MQSTEDKIKSLNEAIKRQDHNQIYEFSKQLLKDHPDDIEYQQCFIISSIKISLSEELGQTQFKNPPNNQALQHLYAYFLYERGDFDKTIQYIQTIKSSLSLKLLLAQAHFRAQNYDKSAALMLALLKEANLDIDKKQQYIINLLATGINSSLSPEVVREYEKIVIKAHKKELLYNYSLIMLETGDYQKCLGFLHQFESSLIKGRDDNDIAMVRLFHDYIEWRVNKNIEKGIVQTYEKLLDKVTDNNVKGVINNNLLFYRQGQVTENTHQILKMMDQSLQSEYKMTKKQKTLILLNKLSVLLRKGRFPEAQKLLKEIQSKDELLSRDTEYIKNKYYLLKKNKDSEISNFVEYVKSTNSELGFCLRADLEKEKGTETDLIADLKAKGKDVMHPVIKNYIFSLLIKHSSLFEQYSDYLSQMAELTTDVNILLILLNIYENKADVEKQKFILLRLLKLQPKNSNIKIKLAKLYLLEQRIADAEEVLRGIEGPEELGDIAYLQFIEKNIHVSIKKEEEVKEQIKKEDSHKKRIKKKKKVRLPKNIDKFVDNFKPDPERWLPKWQRKGYKKKGKKGGGSKTQGLATVGKQQTKNVFTTGVSTSSKEVTVTKDKKRK